jgi:hypothetical protein
MAIKDSEDFFFLSAKPDNTHCMQLVLIKNVNDKSISADMLNTDGTLK